jgi:hypothetical protein
MSPKTSERRRFTKGGRSYWLKNRPKVCWKSVLIKLEKCSTCFVVVISGLGEYYWLGNIPFK